MRRDIGNEVIVAIAAVAVLAFALAFAILLSLSSGGSAEITETPARSTVVSNVDEASPTPFVTSDASQEASPRPPRPPSSTPTLSSQEVDDTPTEDKPPQPVGETVTPTDTTTPTETPTSTLTAPPTDVIANQTTARTPTEAVATDVPATSVDPKPTDAPQATTAAPSTMRTTQTGPTATFTPRVTTAPDGILPTPIGAAPATNVSVSSSTTIPNGTSEDCSPPAGWVQYRVQIGNTLFLIAQSVRSNVFELAQANCIRNVDRIQAGDVIFVPRAPSGPVPTSAVSEHGVLAPMGCQNPDIQIFSPLPGARISGTVTVIGRVVTPDFWYYNVEVRPATDNVYRFYSDSYQQVENGALATIDVSVFGRGQYWLRIAVVNDQGGILDSSICEIPVFFD